MKFTPGYCSEHPNEDEITQVRSPKGPSDLAPRVLNRSVAEIVKNISF